MSSTRLSARATTAVQTQWEHIIINFLARRHTNCKTDVCMRQNIFDYLKKTFRAVYRYSITVSIHAFTKI